MKKKIDKKIKDEEKKSLLLNARNPSGVYEEVFATNGDKAIPPYTYTDGWGPAYESTSFPLRTTFNFMLNRHDAAIVDMNQMGANLQWDTVLTYQQYAQVVASDGNSYRALVSNQGIDPVSDGGSNWELLPTASELSSLQSSIDTLQNEVVELKTFFPVAYVKFDQNANILGSALNISSLSINSENTGVGNLVNITVTMATPLSNTNYRIIATTCEGIYPITPPGNIGIFPQISFFPGISSVSEFKLYCISFGSSNSNLISGMPRQGGIVSVYEF